MRSFVRVALGAVALSTLTAVAAHAQQGGLKIAYINSQQIIAAAPGRSEAEAQVQQEMQAYRTQVQLMGDSLQSMMAAYSKAEPTLSPAAKAGRQKATQDKQSEYEKRAQDLQQKAQERQAEIFRPIMQRINQVIEQIRAEDGYAMIFDAGSQSGVVVAADSSLDITNKVIERLKSTGPVSTTPTKPPAGPTLKPTGPVRPKPQSEN
jgi:outer membrane protein